MASNDESEEKRVDNNETGRKGRKYGGHCVREGNAQWICKKLSFDPINSGLQEREREGRKGYCHEVQEAMGQKLSCSHFHMFATCHPVIFS